LGDVGVDSVIKIRTFGAVNFSGWALHPNAAFELIFGWLRKEVDVRSFRLGAASNNLNGLDPIFVWQFSQIREDGPHVQCP